MDINSFDEWLKTKNGLSCNDDSKLIKKPYLTNRLYWAYQAGNDANPQFNNMQKALKNAYKKISDLRKEIKKKDKTIIKLSQELHNETLLRVGH